MPREKRKDLTGRPQQKAYKRVSPRGLGEEVPIGKGKVDFPRIIGRLKEMKYGGAMTIEREISGPQQWEDVRAAKKYLESLIG